MFVSECLLHSYLSLWISTEYSTETERYQIIYQIWRIYRSENGTGLDTPLVAAAASSSMCKGLCWSWEVRDRRQWRWQWQGWSRRRCGVQHELGQWAGQQPWPQWQSCSWQRGRGASKCGDHQLRRKRPAYHMFPTLTSYFNETISCFEDYDMIHNLWIMVTKLRCISN